MQLISRKEAMSAGLSRYFTGVSCPHGHTAERQVSNYMCVDCGTYRKSVFDKTDVGKAMKRASNKKWREANLITARQKNTESGRRRKGLPEPTRQCPDNCELCGSPPTNKALSLDHCHETGKFRGWLCDRCNKGLGFLGDNLDGILKAVNYLRYQRPFAGTSRQLAA